MPAPSSFDFSISFVGTSPTISLKVLSAIPFKSPPNRISLARIASVVASVAVDQVGHSFGQSLVRFTRAGIFRVFLFQRFDFLLSTKT